MTQTIWTEECHWDIWRLLVSFLSQKGVDICYVNINANIRILWFDSLFYHQIADHRDLSMPSRLQQNSILSIWWQHMLMWSHTNILIIDINGTIIHKNHQNYNIMHWITNTKSTLPMKDYLVHLEDIKLIIIYFAHIYIKSKHIFYQKKQIQASAIISEK